MHSIQIGPFILNGPLLLSLSFGLAGGLMVQNRFRNRPEQGLMLNEVSKAFWIWVIIWKGSLLFFHPIETMQQPMSLLYFDGGERGRWLASLVILVYLLYRALKHKNRISYSIWLETGVWFTFSGWFVYQMILFMVGESLSWFHALNAGMTAALLLSLAVSQSGSATQSSLAYGLWFSIGNVLLLFFVPERSLWILSFSKQQLVFMLIAFSLAAGLWLEEKTKIGDSHG